MCIRDRAGAWRRQIESGQLTPQREHITELGEMAQNTLREVRLLIYELRPTELEEEGFIGALYRRLEAVEKRSGIEARLHITNEDGEYYQWSDAGRSAVVEFYRLPASLELGLYRITQEALNNTLKHSGATTVNVRIRLGVSHISLEIEDNGRGFVYEGGRGHGGGFGLVGLKERAKQLGGKFKIDSSPTSGTTIKVTGIPYRLVGAEEMITQ